MNRVVFLQLSPAVEESRSREKNEMKTSQELALAAVPNPGLQAKLNLVPFHLLAQKLEERDYREVQAKYQKIHQIKFRYVLRELKVLYDWNWTHTFFPSHIPFIKRFSLSKLWIDVGFT